tara:strand:- start:3349 stop:3693 length:345 start_codon:yes stop_codon:yes gene_type:complete
VVLFGFAGVRSGTKGRLRPCQEGKGRRQTPAKEQQQQPETETATASATASRTARARQTARKPKAKTTAQKKLNQQPPHQKNLGFAQQCAVVKASSTLNPNICDKNLLSLQKITL